MKQKLNRSPKKDKKDVNLGDLLHMESGLDLNNLNELESLDTLYDLDKLTNSSNSSINLIDECDLLNEFSIDKIDEYCNNLNKIHNQTNSQASNPTTNLDDNQLVDTIIENMLKESKLIISQDAFEPIINQLCKQATQIFEDSALKLNLKYLIIFLEQLISNSNRQLYSISNSDKSTSNRSTVKPLVKSFNYNCLLFDRFCDVIIKIIKSSRPIFHLMKSLHLASEHLIAAASFEYSEKVRKTSISTLNDLISNFMLNHSELEHFHFNESLFKPYETLLLLELCEMDIQEMIISSVCGFVEGYSNEVGSGWKSLFRALCGVRLLGDPAQSTNQSTNQTDQPNCVLTWSEEIECVRQLRVILDIFDSFLNDSFQPNAFSQGAIECLNCLFKMLKKNTNELDNLDEMKTKNSFINLNLISLRCLDQFECTLRKFYSTDLMINHKPNFCSITFKTKLIHVQNSELEFTNLSKYLKDDLAKQSDLIDDWYIYYYYLYGLSTSIQSCSIDHQSKLIEILLSSLGFLAKESNCEFGIYSFNHLAFNCIQSWTTSLNEKLDNQSNESDLVLNKIEFSNYKHFCIIVTNLVVEFVKLEQGEQITGTNLLIYQFYVLFGECLIDEYNFMISTLAVSCLKHVLKESTKFLTKQQCELVLHVFNTINKTSLRTFQKLINFFACTTNADKSTNELANLNLVGRLINDQDNNLGLEAEMAYQLLMQSYLNNQIELANAGHLTKIYSFELDNEHFTINKLIKKLLFIDLTLKEIGGLVLGTLDGDYRIKEFTSFEIIKRSPNSHLDRTNLIELIEHISHVFDQMDASSKVKFLLQKISMFKPMINFYQINSVCFLLKFLFHYDLLINHQSEETGESPINELTKLVEKMIIEYIQFKKDRKIILVDRPDYSDFINKVNVKLVRNQRKPIEESDLKMKLNKLDEQMQTKRCVLNQTFYNQQSNDSKQSRTDDFDTECYLYIWNKIINSMLSLQIELDDRLFTRTIPCFILMNYYLLSSRNCDDFIINLYDWLIRLDCL